MGITSHDASSVSVGVSVAQEHARLWYLKAAGNPGRAAFTEMGLELHTYMCTMRFLGDVGH